MPSQTIPNRFPASRPQQQGLALFTALMMLLIITIIGISSVRTGMMEAQMASNEELRIAAFQVSESAIAAIPTIPANTAVIGGVGRTVCTANWPTACDANTLTIPADVLNMLANPNQIAAKVTRIQPDSSGGSPTPIKTGYGVNIGVANFRIKVRYNGSSTGLGNSEIVQGYQLIYPIFK